jgi:hypothetical protein
MSAMWFGYPDILLKDTLPKKFGKMSFGKMSFGKVSFGKLSSHRGLVAN